MCIQPRKDDHFGFTCNIEILGDEEGSMLVAGTYRDSSDCEKVRQQLRAEQISPQKVTISVLEGGGILDRTLVGTRALKYARYGGALGAVLGAIAGLFAGILRLAVPRLGTVIVSGPLLLCLAGAVLFAMAGGALGLVVGLNFRNYESRTHPTTLDKGYLLSVSGNSEEQLQDAERIIRAAGAVDILWMSSDSASSITPPLTANVQKR